MACMMQEVVAITIVEHQSHDTQLKLNSYRAVCTESVELSLYPQADIFDYHHFPHVDARCSLRFFEEPCNVRKGHEIWLVGVVAI